MLLGAYSIRGTWSTRKLPEAQYQSNKVWGDDKGGWAFEDPHARCQTSHLNHSLHWEAHTHLVHWEQSIDRKEDPAILSGILVQDDSKLIWVQVVLKIQARFTLSLSLFFGYIHGTFKSPGQGWNLSHSSDNVKSSTAGVPGNSCFGFILLGIFLKIMAHVLRNTHLQIVIENTQV